LNHYRPTCDGNAFLSLPIESIEHDLAVGKQNLFTVRSQKTEGTANSYQEIQVIASEMERLANQLPD